MLLLLSLALSLSAGQTFGATAQDKAAALGARLASTVRAQTTPLQIEGAGEYVTTLGRRLAARIPNAPPDWRFTVVTQPGNWAHEPLALPGRYVFVPAALIASSENEAELAAVLAHAMIHATSPALEGTIPLLFVRTDLGSDDSYLVPSSLRAMEQEREMEADALAVQAILNAGFDTSALLSYLDRQQLRNTVRSPADRAVIAARLTPLRQRLATLTVMGAMQLSSSAFVLVQDRIVREVRARTKQPEMPSLFAIPR